MEKNLTENKLDILFFSTYIIINNKYLIINIINLFYILHVFYYKGTWQFTKYAQPHILLCNLYEVY